MPMIVEQMKIAGTDVRILKPQNMIVNILKEKRKYMETSKKSKTKKHLLIPTMGLPRCGKSTWSREMAKKYGIPIVCPDSIRISLYARDFIAEAEPMVWTIAKYMVKSLFHSGHPSVILDATNLNNMRDEWHSKGWDTAFKQFNTKKEICIKRAISGKRDYLVPVIERMDRFTVGLAPDETKFTSKLLKKYIWKD